MLARDGSELTLVVALVTREGRTLEVWEACTEAELRAWWAANYTDYVGSPCRLLWGTVDVETWLGAGPERAWQSMQDQVDMHVEPLCEV